MYKINDIVYFETKFFKGFGQIMNVYSNFHENFREYGDHGDLGFSWLCQQEDKTLSEKTHERWFTVRFIMQGGGAIYCPESSIKYSKSN